MVKYLKHTHGKYVSVRFEIKLALCKHTLDIENNSVTIS